MAQIDAFVTPRPYNGLRGTDATDVASLRGQAVSAAGRSQEVQGQQVRLSITQLQNSQRRNNYTALRPVSKFTTATTRAITRSKWIKEPATWNPHPKSQRISKIAKMVQSIGSASHRTNIGLSLGERQPLRAELSLLRATLYATVILSSPKQSEGVSKNPEDVSTTRPWENSFTILLRTYTVFGLFPLRLQPRSKLC
jgi:hypothetical protein